MRDSTQHSAVLQRRLAVAQARIKELRQENADLRAQASAWGHRSKGSHRSKDEGVWEESVGFTSVPTFLTDAAREPPVKGLLLGGNRHRASLVQPATI